MESKKRVKRTRRKRAPKMRLDLKADINRYIVNRIDKQRANIVKYLLTNPEFGLNATSEEDIEHLTTAYEKAKHYASKVHTVRFKGEIILQEFPLGLSWSDGVRFKSPLIKN